MSTVIVFGATGSVGSVVARTAQEQGAKVVLAMRDPQKAIPTLGPNIDKDFIKVKADLTDSASVKLAIEKTKAKRAFLYVAHGTPDHMLSSITALKSGGIEFVVLLSSFTIKGDPKDVPPSEIIPFVHAKVELSLSEVFGEHNYVALRPGGFATNILRYKKGIQDGKVPIFGASFAIDCVSPNDMGRVGGNILVHGPKNGQKKVYIYGPQIISQGEAIKRVGKVLGKTLELESMNEEQAMSSYLGAGIPKMLAEYIIRKTNEEAEDAPTHRANYDEGVANVQLYTGRPAEKLEEWVESDKQMFST